MLRDSGLSVGIIVTTYNNIEALRLVIQSIHQQTRLPQEIIIADDGSNAVLSDYVGDLNELIPIKHCWLPDIDFRAARSRNLAIMKTSSKYLIFIDGDCWLPPDFIKSHLSLASPNKIIAGGRSLLTKAKTDALLREYNFSIIQEELRKLKFRRLYLGPLRDKVFNSWRNVRSCNLGIFRDAVFETAGFDESFIGWGKEDSDFILRCLNRGMLIRNGRFATSVIHLWHESSSKFKLSRNLKLLENTLENHSINPTRSSLSFL